MKKLLLITLITISFLTGYSQYWEQSLGSTGNRSSAHQYQNTVKTIELKDGYATISYFMNQNLSCSRLYYSNLCGSLRWHDTIPEQRGRIVNGLDNTIMVFGEDSIYHYDILGNKLDVNIAHRVSDYNVLVDVKQTPDSGYVCFFINLNENMNITKYNKNVELVWSKTYELDDRNVSNNFYGYGLNILKDSGIVFSGQFTNGIDGNNVVFGKLDSDGNLLWKKVNGATYLTNLPKVIESPDSSIFIFSSNPSKKITIQKYSQNGDSIFHKVIEDIEMYTSLQFDLAILDSSIVLAYNKRLANYYYSSCILGVNKNGEVLWNKEFEEIAPKHSVYTITSIKNDCLAMSGKIDLYGDSYCMILSKDLELYSNQYVSTCNEYISPSGKIWKASGTYIDTAYTQSGCDSIIIIDLTINHSSVSNITTTVCDYYVSPSGKILTASGVYTDTLPNTFGCDSVITIDLTVNHSSTSNITETACESYTSPSGKIWIKSDVYTDTVPNILGCDSIITIDLTINCVNTISKNSTLPVSVYPNPINNFFTIELSERCDNLSMEIYFITGQLITNKNYKNIQRFTYHLEGESGIYIIKLNDNKGKNNIIELIKQ